jgi:hypothetical protein
MGWKVFAGLVVLTILEYWVASMAQGPIPYPVLCAPFAPITWLASSVSRNAAPYLAILAVGKAFLILRFLMHVAQLWAAQVWAAQIWAAHSWASGRDAQGDDG